MHSSIALTEIDIARGVLDIIGGDVAAQMTTLEFVRCHREQTLAFHEFQMLGETVAARWAADGARAKLTMLMAALDKSKKQMSSADPNTECMTMIKEAHTDASTIVEQVADFAIQDASIPMLSATEELQEIAGGSQDRKCWSEGIEASTIDVVLETGKNTLLKVNAKVLLDRIETASRVTGSKHRSVMLDTLTHPILNKSVYVVEC
jgi:hypothetical protein